MIDKINSSVAIGVDRATKKAAEALERVTNRLAGEPDNAIDRAVSLRLSSQYSSNYLNARNAQDNISYMQTRDGALGSVTGQLQRLRDLAVQMGNPILNESDKGLIRQQADMIMQDIESTAKSSEFNTQKILGDVSLDSLGLNGLNFGSDGTISAIDNAIQTISTKRVETGATITTLEARIDNYAITNQNLAKAIETRSGSLMQDIVDLTDSVNRAMVAVKVADLVIGLDREKVHSLLDKM